MEGSGREGLRRSLSHALSPQEVGADGASRPACASHPEVFTSPCLQAGLSASVLPGCSQQSFTAAAEGWSPVPISHPFAVHPVDRLVVPGLRYN